MSRGHKTSIQAKHPVILSSKHFVTRLILKEKHINLHHCRSEQLLASIRQRYWIVSGRKKARKIMRSYLNCFRLRPKNAQVKMGDLSVARVTSYVRLFTISDVDYASPIQIKENRHRERKHTSKANIALFIYFNMKAIYIELVILQRSPF